MTKKSGDEKSRDAPTAAVNKTWDEDTRTAPVRVDPIQNPTETVPCMVVVAGPQLGQVFPITGNRATIGRGEEADWCISETSISRRHAVVYKDEEAFCRIRDLNSKNGTYVNGNRIGDTVLTAADKVQLGKTSILKFEYHSELEGRFHAHLYEAGTTDPLTGIYNRRYFDGHLHADFRLCIRHGEPLSIIMIDIDHFKKVNDTHGHLAGDSVLRQLAEKLATRVRTEDILARYGGEEFIIILRRTSPKGAAALSEAIRDLIEKTQFEFQHSVAQVTVSVGVATMETKADFGDANELLEAADKALFKAKEHGRNRVVRHRG
ncbi:MAG: GGDEF domain-containing protein [Myxococcota bacterium]